MIVWGGDIGGLSLVNTGGTYNPTLDTWAPTSTGANVPTVRYSHTAVWTGTRMIVWGGMGPPGALNSGGVYDPALDTWAPTSVGINLPTARANHTAVSMGGRMIVWGGNGSSSGTTPPPP
jgi:hypothetical protein